MTVYPTTTYDSWVSLADAETYFGKRMNSEAWDALSDPNKEVALQQAFRSLDEMSYTFVFTSATVLTFATSYYTAAQIAIMIAMMENAQCEQALHEILNNPDFPDVQSVDLGGLRRVSFPAKKSKGPPRFAARAIAMIRTFLRAKTVTMTR